MGGVSTYRRFVKLLLEIQTSNQRCWIAGEIPLRRYVDRFSLSPISSELYPDENRSNLPVFMYHGTSIGAVSYGERGGVPCNTNTI